MQALEFSAEVHGANLTIPPSVAARLPESAIARVILLLDEDSEDHSWRQAAYQQFLSDDTAEDSIYDAVG